ncbi:MAG: serine protease Do [Chloroflexota bacterium]|nr:serine protease Do [Chloroflexota bacterium]
MNKLYNRFTWIVGLLAAVLLLSLACIDTDFSFSDVDLEQATTQPLLPAATQPVAADYLPTVLARIEGTPLAEDRLPVSAVVQIVVRGTVEGIEQEWSGSGTIISPDGLILTNAHVAMGDRFYPAEELLIMLTVAEDALPEAAFYAEVMQADENLDIAVLRPSNDLQGQPVDRSTLNLPFVSLGDSDNLHLGDDILILGYPGIGGETITLTRGEVSGFTSQEGYGNRAFIKTSATIAGGNSGGLALDGENHLIGIPTEVGAGEEYADVVDCRPLADTNRDGAIDDYDTCVPTGGFINALRPVNLALPLIDAALNNEVAYTTESYPEVEIAADSPVFYQDDFSDTATGWPEYNDRYENYSYQNGRYRIEIDDENYIRPITGGESLTDMVVRIQAQVEQSSGDGEYGLICRYQDDNNMYMFEITEDGYYAIYKLYRGDWTPLIDYTYSSMVASLQGADIQASCVGDTLRLAVNGKLLGEAQDSVIPSGDYGFFAGTFTGSGIVVSFDDLVVSQP